MQDGDFLEVIKRDGNIVDFDSSKIKNAINKAFYQVYQNYNFDVDDLTDSVVEKIKDRNAVSVETIQDIVEHTLMENEYFDVAKAYITYRYDRQIQRNQKLINQMKEKLEASNVKNQNANVDEKSFGGRMGEAEGVILKDYALNHCMSKMARDNHLNNEIYIHDLNHYAVGDHNCLTIPFDDLLANGFNTRQTDVRPAQSVNTAFQLVAVIFQLQSLMQFG